MKSFILYCGMIFFGGALVGFIAGEAWTMWFQPIKNHPVEFTVIPVEEDKYSVEVRNTDDHTIHIKLAYLDDRDDTSGIVTYVGGPDGERVESVADDLYECRCTTQKAYRGAYWWRAF